MNDFANGTVVMIRWRISSEVMTLGSSAGSGLVSSRAQSTRASVTASSRFVVPDRRSSSWRRNTNTAGDLTCAEVLSTRDAPTAFRYAVTGSRWVLNAAWVWAVSLTCVAQYDAS